MKNKKMNDKKWNLLILILNTTFSWLGILLIFIALMLYAFMKPFPERLFVEQMPKEMIESGQARTLISITSCAFPGLGFLIIDFGICIWLIIYLFVNQNYYWDKKVLYKKSELFKNYSLKFLLLIGHILLPFFIVIYFWLVYIKKYNNKLTNKKWILTFSEYRGNKKGNVILVTGTSLALPIIVPICAISYIMSPYQYDYPLSKNINKYLEFSNTQPNALVLYFDTTTALYWNLMLMVDDVLNGENSFIQKFPEFTTFYNTLTTACPTVYSNPAIYSGHLYDPYFKNYNVQTKSLVNNNLNINTSNMTYDQYYLEAFSNLLTMVSNQGFQDLKINNAPYYGETYTITTGEMLTLENDLKNKKNLNVTTMDTVTLASQKMGRKLRKFTHNSSTEAYVLRNLSNNIIFNKTNSGVFNYYFNQSHHWPSSYMVNGKYKADITIYSEYYFHTLYESIQSLKLLFDRFKNEPFYDSNNKMIEDQNGSYIENGRKYISVYDKTMFIIQSDHGYYLNPYKNKFIDQIMNAINLTDEQKRIVKAYGNQQYNPVIQIKNFNYDKNNNPTSQIKDITPENDSWYNNERLLTLSDFVFIIESLLKKYNDSNLNNDDSMFYSRNVIDQKFKKYLDSIVFKDPLSSNINDINARQIYVSWAYDWNYFYNDKEFKFAFFNQFINNKNFFDDNNFKPTKLEQSLFIK